MKEKVIKLKTVEDVPLHPLRNGSCWDYTELEINQAIVEWSSELNIKYIRHFLTSNEKPNGKITSYRYGASDFSCNAGDIEYSIHVFYE